MISDRQDAFWLDDDGNLVYAHDERGNRLPDFSHVGYRNGETAIPDVDVVVTLHPSPDGGDDTSRIQAALDRAGTVEPGPDGLRGAVLLKGGTYRIKGSLQMQRSGVVLRGEDGETLLVAAGYGTLENKRALIVDGDPAEPQPIEASRSEITDDYAPVGAHRFSVASTEGYRAGSKILVFRPSTAEWIASIGMDQIPEKFSILETSRWVKDGDVPGFYYVR